MDENKVNLVILISGNGSNLQSIIDAIDNHKLDAHIQLVISSNHKAYGLERAKRASIPTQIINPNSFSSKSAFENTLLKHIEVAQPKLMVLAGFMHILSANFVGQFSNKILNIHPSLLPKFKGLNTHQRALDSKETEHGATVHFVTPDLDNGPIIIQAKVPIHDSDDAMTLQRRVLKQEHIIYPKAIQRVILSHVKLSK